MALKGHWRTQFNQRSKKLPRHTWTSSQSGHSPLKILLLLQRGGVNSLRQREDGRKPSEVSGVSGCRPKEITSQGSTANFFEGLVHPAVLDRARHVAVWGAHWGVEAAADLEETSRLRSSPHPSLKEHLHEAAEQLWDDASKGRSLLCFDVGQGLEGVVSVPMARVPKMNPDRTLSDKGRVIWDATPVNRYCHKSRHPPALQPRHQEVARAILWWKLRLPRIRILLSKKDVSEAFKWISAAGGYETLCG